MTTKTLPLATGRLEAVFTVFKKDLVFTSSIILAMASCFIAEPQASYIDFKVLACLFNIMIVVKAFEELHLLERMSVGILNGCNDSRRVSLVLVTLSFFSSMLFTNDVALLTLVPLTLVISRKSGLEMMPTVIMQTLIAFLLTAFVALCVNRGLLLKADYPLLMTFVCFFIFIGNISHIPAVNSLMKGLLDNGTSTYFGSILLSQAISNVPSAILLSGFTPHWKELLLGVNVGGMGTIIASLASVILYKLYIGEKPENAGKYIAKFSLYNFVSLALFALLNYLLLQVCI